MEQLLKLVLLTPSNGALQIGQIFGEALQHLQNRLVIIYENVAPHDRIRGGNTREVSKTRGRESDYVIL